MERLQWTVKSFNQLTGKEVYEIMKARVDVFVVEQECLYHEVDPYDLVSLHVFTTDEDGVITAYARIFEIDDGMSFGRVLVRKDCRGKGLASLLVAKVLRVIKKRFAGMPIAIEAQEYVQSLYLPFGFEPASEIFMLDGIPHIRMEKR
ncbi:GNAT family N-acetyltransferase [Sporolactobacillus shoreicorticis]|uniref:GNAT family N-acetyltransferase n=1 Tax=Sporolactobacillus shoreicorticis TaxID=1923877 RepID=A0ABW5S2E0_9BACL|nr:GNAT family N-acetyltransferase [Sporolactobacillus shoreicorticis]MCO7125888.1 GNAT family N-acetyltransferase [Sporolactobacillus shoreicorticis]